MRVGAGTALIGWLICAPAFAADMAVKVPPASAQATVPSWEGFYLGADVGYGIGVTQFNEPIQGDFFGTHGFTGGLLAGYNHMLTPRWLLGVEGDVSWGNIDHKEEFNDGSGDVAKIKIAEKQAESVRGRLGYLLEPNTLLYVTGGWSWAQFSYAFVTTFAGFETATLHPNGPEVGFGVETMLGGGWNARLEYLEAFYNRGSFASPLLAATLDSFGSSTFAPTVDQKPAVGIGRFALIYRFGAGDGAPLTAPLPAPSWNGPTIAATAAAVSATAKVDSWAAPGNAIDGIGASAVLPTALLGYNWRVAPRWVFGVDVGVAPGISATDFYLDWTESSHARFGYLLTPATMAYASVGWFGTGFHTTAIATNIIAPKQWANALEVGAGVETALDEHWAARFEYQYGLIQTIHDVTVNFPSTPLTTPLAVSIHPQVQSAQAGLVYNFAIR